MTNFDVVVVGAGHAGCEAAAAAARLGGRVALVSMRREYVARLSCNPAIGGLAKGHLVRELDALGGLMGRVTDASSIQFRRLNTRKGLAVQSSRAQVDIDVYPLQMQQRLAAIPTLNIVEGEVTDLVTAGGRVTGVILADDTTLTARAVVLATGTFLAAVMHCGDAQTVGGRIGDGAATALAQHLRSLGLRTHRLKTGTVPRLARDSVDWERLEVQQDTIPDGRFSFAAERPKKLPQISCHLTYTGPKAHQLIRNAIDRSPLFNGSIEGVGPRYCPSIEDKVMRFPERDRHLLFLEPEGLNSSRVYVNGLSTSMPADVQDDVVHSIEGLEQAVIVQHGYAVEYDIADPRDLDHGLQHTAIAGLFLAGQVNGTSGYEEAAVQGFVAGVSAMAGTPFQLGRDEAYIGVLIDDLTSRGVGGEPYRMFTSRAEHRLLLREDNADSRLMQKGRDLGLIDDATWEAFQERAQCARAAKAALKTSIPPTPQAQKRMSDAGLGRLTTVRTAEEILRRPEADYDGVRIALAEWVNLPMLPKDVASQVAVEVKYAGYIARANRRARSADQLDAKRLPPDVDWMSIDALSWEVRERLRAAQPRTLGQIARLPGITPAAVNVVVAWLARQA